MNTHRYYAVIRAWLDCKPIQCRVKKQYSHIVGKQSCRWHDYIEPATVVPLFDHPHYEWRIKPTVS